MANGAPPEADNLNDDDLEDQPNEEIFLHINAARNLAIEAANGLQKHLTEIQRQVLELTQLEQNIIHNQVDDRNLGALSALYEFGLTESTILRPAFLAALRRRLHERDQEQTRIEAAINSIQKLGLPAINITAENLEIYISNLRKIIESVENTTLTQSILDKTTDILDKLHARAQPETIERTKRYRKVINDFLKILQNHLTASQELEKIQQRRIRLNQQIDDGIQARNELQAATEKHDTRSLGNRLNQLKNIEQLGREAEVAMLREDIFGQIRKAQNIHRFPVATLQEQIAFWATSLNEGNLDDFSATLLQNVTLFCDPIDAARLMKEIKAIRPQNNP